MKIPYIPILSEGILSINNDVKSNNLLENSLKKKANKKSEGGTRSKFLSVCSCRYEKN